jgi:2-polyprenyl-3-methyl-5-hydroxy-6-metoxy-1,4-benzoquinol methylase
VNFGTAAGLLLGRCGFSLEAQWPKFKVRRQRLRRKLFTENTLYDETARGFYRLGHMPSDEDLAEYYASEYWQHRGDQGVWLTERDLSHYFLLRSLSPTLFMGNLREKSVLNFGAGHGGISNILQGLGFMVVDIEPGNTSRVQTDRHKSYSSFQDAFINAANMEFDLIYSSHALEHVSDIDATFARFNQVAKENSLFFFEVPDATCEGEGGFDGTVRPPHTYYFSLKFFEGSFSKVLMSRSFDSREPRDVSWAIEGGKTPKTKGDTIQVLAQGLESHISTGGSLN